MCSQERRATERQIKEAAFRVLKTIETFDFAAQVSIHEPLVRGLLRGENLSQRKNLLLVGNPVTGKAHLATALGFAACRQGKRVRFLTVTGLVTQLLEQRDTRTMQRLHQQLERLDVLILDAPVLALDGKTLRGSGTTRLAGALNLPSGRTVAPECVADERNEIPAGQTLLRRLELDGLTVLLDAFHTQEETAQATETLSSAHPETFPQFEAGAR